MYSIDVSAYIGYYWDFRWDINPTFITVHGTPARVQLLWNSGRGTLDYVLVIPMTGQANKKCAVLI